MMKKASPAWLLGLNLVIAFAFIGFFLVAWDAITLRVLSFSQLNAISWGTRMAIVAVIAIGLAGLIWEIRRGRRTKSGRRSPRWAAHLAAPLLLVPGLIIYQAKAAPPVSYAPPWRAAYACEDVRLPLPCGDLLAGSLTLPRGRGAKFPAVVLITGSSPQDRDNASPGASINAYRPFRQIAHRLSSHGIAVLRMDDRGVGASVGGDLSQLTTAERATDIAACIAYLKQRSDIDAARIGLIGISEGVSIAHMIAAQDSRIKALVLLSGIGSPGREVLRYQVQQGVLGEDELATLLKTDKNTRFLNEFDSLLTAGMIKQPVLILHGDRDRYVPYTDAILLKGAITANGNTNVTLVLLPGYGHALLREDPSGTLRSARVPDEVLAAIQDWLTRELQVAAAAPASRR